MAIALTAAYALVAIGMGRIALPVIAKLGIELLLALSLFRRLVLFRHQTALMTLRSDGRIALKYPDADAVEYEVGPGTTVLPWLVVLHAKTSEGKKLLVLPRDAMEPDAHRQLRVWLRWRVSLETE